MDLRDIQVHLWQRGTLQISVCIMSSFPLRIACMRRRKVLALGVGMMPGKQRAAAWGSGLLKPRFRAS
jgi:hypothetical protein